MIVGQNGYSPLGAGEMPASVTFCTARFAGILTIVGHPRHMEPRMTHDSENVWKSSASPATAVRAPRGVAASACDRFAGDVPLPFPRLAVVPHVEVGDEHPALLEDVRERNLALRAGHGDGRGNLDHRHPLSASAGQAAGPGGVEPGGVAASARGSLSF